LAGEVDEDYNLRIDSYLADGLMRGTMRALRWLVSSGGLAAVASGAVTEDLATGIITIRLTPRVGYNLPQAVAAVAAVIDAWRPAGHAVNLLGVV
jgi:hypothetical protein